METMIQLKFLTADDQRLLMEKARHVKFDRGDVVIEEASRLHAIYIVRSGMVSVQRTLRDKTIHFDTLAEGEIFGEMSFLEGTGASAAIVADEPSEISIIDGEWVTALLESVPGLSARFYKSIAVTLSQRLWASHARELG